MPINFHTYQDSLAPILANIWNASMKDQYGYFPVTAQRLRQHFYSTKWFNSEYLLLLKDGKDYVGFIHYDVVDVRGYDRAGVVCALGVIPEYRQRGLGDKLLGMAVKQLEEKRVTFIDAAGAWPYSSFYATLIDGSERAGINNKNQAGSWLFSNYYFYPGRASYTMTKCLSGCQPYDIPSTNIYSASRSGCSTWLDHAFRDWNLFDHELLDNEGRILSRCIYSRMNGISDYTSRERYSVFGVNTPDEFQGQGYATLNIKLLCNRLIADKVDELELHVYQDNIPALKLYRRLGFNEIGETVIMRRY